MRLVSSNTGPQTFLPPTLNGLELDLVNACEAGDTAAAYASVDAWATNCANARNLSDEKRQRVISEAQRVLRGLMKGRHSPASIHALVGEEIRSVVAELSP